MIHLLLSCWLLSGSVCGRVLLLLQYFEVQLLYLKTTVLYSARDRLALSVSVAV